MNRSVWTESARHDLASLDDRHGMTTDYANRVGRAALAAARFLAANPLAGPTLASGLRKWSVGRTSFVLVYRPVTTGVQIIRLLDGRSDWQAVFD